jgi:NTP pyrophosphatase (non-canonical NTP hydrolase)
MEGTVTISLKDYEELKRKAKEHDNNDSRFLRLAVEYIELFEKIEKFLKIEEIETELIEEIGEVLSEWYA